MLCFISCNNSLCCNFISVVVIVSCFNKMIMVNLLIYFATTFYQFVFFPVILMILLYLASPFLTASSCFCLAYHYNSMTNYKMFSSLLSYTIWNGIIIGIFVTVSAKTRHVRTQTEIYFIAPAYSYTNNYACSLPPLANVDWSAFPECFLPTM